MEIGPLIIRETERPFEPTGRQGESSATSDPRESYDDRRNHILAAATLVFAQVGYGQATMRAVAKAAQVSLSGMYHYFDGKEKMLFLIQFRAFNSLLQNLREKLHGVEDPTEQLKVMVRAHVGYFSTNMPALKVCSHELDTLTGEGYEDLRRIRHEYYELTRKIVQRVVERRATGNGLNQHVVTMSLFGTLNWLYRWYSPGPERSSTGLADQITELFLTGVDGPKPLAGDGQPS